jgi:toxin FitB
MIVLDTNVLSEVMKPTPAAAVAAWLARHKAEDLFITAVTEAEILFGAAILPGGRRKQALKAEAYRVFSLFSGRILPFDSAAAWIFSEIVPKRQRIGRPIAAFDAQIAAIASSRSMTLATRNTRDFDGVGLTLIDPWQG